jgi:hypothetical protein
MSIKIEPINFDYMDCVLDNIISVVSWLERDYEFMFSRSWAFELETSGKNSKIGEMIKSGISLLDQLTLLENYHGIKIIRNIYNTVQDLLNSIRCELLKQLPTLVFLDEYWLPWSNKFQTTHYPGHGCLVTGIINNEKIIITDPWYKKQNVCLTLRDFKQSARIESVTFIIKDKINNESLKWKELLIGRCKELVDQTNNTFQKLRTFADIIENNLDIVNETKDCEHIYQIQLVSRTLVISRNRKQYSMFLHYLWEQYKAYELANIHKSMDYISYQWDIVCAMIKKAMFLSSIAEIKDRIANRVRGIANLEEKLANDVISMYEIGTNYENSKLVDLHTPPISSIYSYKNRIQKHVELTNYFNNKGFCNDNAELSTADFTGVGEFFLVDNSLLNHHTINAEEMSFLIPNFESCIYDNISCSEQIIEVPEGYYTGIAVLGCSTWGSFSTQITICNSKQELIKIPVKFTEWISPPVYEETIAWSGTGIRKKVNNEAWKAGVSLFAKSYMTNLKEPINKIILPDAPNFRIFALTLI